MWSTQRENRRRALVSAVDMGEIILVVIVFVGGVGGFMYAALKEDDEK